MSLLRPGLGLGRSTFAAKPRADSCPSTDLRNPLRTIVHIDIDAAYAGMEMSRLGIPWDSDIPVCVQQWQGLIAVNYPARKFGITRHESPASALEKCPHLTMVHCATYGPGDTEPSYNHSDPKPETHKVSGAGQVANPTTQGGD